MAPIRVLQVFNKMDRGGAETAIMNIYRFIDRNRVQFDFLVHDPSHGDFNREIQKLGGRIFVAPKFRVLNLRHYKTFLNNFFKNHPELRVVHGHQYNTAAVYLSVAKNNNRYTIAHSHNTRHSSGIYGPVKWFFRYQLLPIPNHCFACSTAAGQWLFRGKRSFEVLPNAIPSKKYAFSLATRDAVRSELSLQKNNLVIGHVGSFGKAKNHKYLLKIFRSFIDKNPSGIMLLIGDGPLRISIQKQISSLGLTKYVRLLGIRSDIHRLLQAMDIFVMPSLYEGLPVTLVEAQASGLSCLIADNISKDVALTDLVHYQSIHRPTNEWANKIELIATGSQIRRDRSESIKRAGYDVITLATKLQDFYIDCAAKIDET